MSLSDFNALCLKAEGRDKLARVAQYAARAIAGFTSMARPQTGSRMLVLDQKARAIMVQLASARRTFRWCKEFPVIQGIPKSLNPSQPIDTILEFLQKVSLATFLIIDHIGWLKQVKILRGGKRAGTGTIQMGLKFFCLSNLVGAIYQAKQLQAASANKDDNSKFNKSVQNMVKHLLLVVQTAHLSLLWQSHDAIVGVLGVITSSMDVIQQWPEKKAKRG